MLPQETSDRIQKEADKEYPFSISKFEPQCYTRSDRLDFENQAYIKGATAEADKATALATFIEKFISRHEAGLLPDRFIYEEGLNTLASYTRGKGGN